MQGRPSGEGVIEEEDEDEIERLMGEDPDGEGEGEFVEEVEEFSPLGTGEIAEVLEEEEERTPTTGARRAGL